MRRLILIFFVFVVLGIGLMLVFRDNSGYVQIAFAGWRIETSLLFAGAVVIIGLWILLTLWRLVIAAAIAPSHTRHWFRNRRVQKAQSRQNAGLQALAQGQWKRARHLLTQRSQDYDQPGINYIYAAQAAHFAKDYPARDQLLAKAPQLGGITVEAACVVQARLQLEQRQTKAAQKTLEQVLEYNPQHAWALAALAKTYYQENDSHALRQLLPKLYSARAVSKAQLETWVEWAALQRLTQHHAKRATLETIWQDLGKTEQKRPALQLAYAQQLHRFNDDPAAYKICQKLLKKSWQPQAALLLCQMPTLLDNRALAMIESWLSQYGQKPELLFLASLACRNNKLQGRADSYLNKCLQAQLSAPLRHMVGQQLKQYGQIEQALQLYQAHAPAENKAMSHA